MSMTSWSTPFLRPTSLSCQNTSRHALIILNQPFASSLLERLWAQCSWRACADGGANRLHDGLSQGLRDRCMLHVIMKEYISDITAGQATARSHQGRLGFAEGRRTGVLFRQGMSQGQCYHYALLRCLCSGRPCCSRRGSILDGPDEMHTSARSERACRGRRGE
jgi:hypothetical protein